jgi:hypothetical protein
MNREPMPEELRRFVLRSVPSIPFVEALLIFRAQAGAPVTIEAIAKRLYISERDAAGIVEQLRDAQIVQQGAEGNAYAPDAELAPVLDLLADYYRSQLVDFTALVHSRTGRMAQHFSDAFKLRKD